MLKGVRICLFVKGENTCNYGCWNRRKILKFDTFVVIFLGLREHEKIVSSTTFRVVIETSTPFVLAMQKVIR